MGNQGTSIKISDKKYEIIKILRQSELGREILVKNKSNNNNFLNFISFISYIINNVINK